MSELTVPLLIVGGTGLAYYALKKRKDASVMPPPAMPAPPITSESEEIIDIQGFGYFGDDASVSLKSLHAEVAQHQALAATKCPKLVQDYKDLASDIAYEMTLENAGKSDPTFPATAKGQLKVLNSACAKGVSVTAGSPSERNGSILAMFAIAGLALFLIS